MVASWKRYLVRFLMATIVASFFTIFVSEKAFAYRTSYEEESASYTGSWGRTYQPGYSGGYSRYSNVAGSTCEFTFTGSSVAWISRRGIDYGSAKIYVDGVYIATYNLNANWMRDMQLVYVTKRSEGTHTLKIVAVGDGYIGVDRFDVDVDYAQYLIIGDKEKWGHGQNVSWAYLRTSAYNSTPVPSSWEPQINAAASEWGYNTDSWSRFPFIYDSNREGDQYQTVGMEWLGDSVGTSLTLGITRVGYNSITHLMNYAYTRYNNSTDIEWSTNGTYSTSRRFKCDVRSLALHEFGHWIHLNDITDENNPCPNPEAFKSAVMYGGYDSDTVLYGNSAGPQIHILKPYDQEGVAVNYHW